MTGSNRKKRMKGIVLSDKADKTVVVAIERLKSHKKYKKKIIATKRFMAHDFENKCKIGDRVEIEEVAPISKHKKWKISQIINGKE